MKLNLPGFVLTLCLYGTLICSVYAEDSKPYLYILDVAQDAGYPQAGCYKKHCMPGWQDSSLRQGAVSLGLIDPETHQKYMFDATPNFPAQLFALDSEAPNDQYELAGIFLTHAHIGHYAGLMFLGHEVMGASNVPVHAMPRMAQFLTDNGPWSQLVDYKNIILNPMQDNQTESFGRIKITPFLVPHRDEYSETVGYRIVGPNKSAVFIPDIDKWSDWQTDLSELVKSVDYALIDATFFADGELPGRDMSKIRHPFVSESMELLKNLPADERKKVWFIHMNHTNPLLNPQSTQSQQVRSAGFNIATQYQRLDL
ncbi:MAG: pyrroloquinoline quinone biosynthesis protein PqqB [Xanthomonadales bacterium]|nr:pyrroloquinoline quinone biosynthesis protein PqqB [Xanthomonadales bacterium]